ncbi:unnamed protein product [Cyprideis torosa]|uniref:Uncharacterized protein n=1 Tax=Cyprideis torosa TaxID=163714 RepID=A0A7R8ZS89_9CRUS|nr:unnamed protein product [Cyprideis torosa]CAG0905343.1 unnamed protein product [Cyprideis torosa]
MLAKVQSAIVVGVDAFPLTIEVDIASGLPMFSTVGLPDGAVRESKDRVKAAIRNCGYAFPQKKITVNLAPADVRKEGAGYDLPIAMGILAATDLLPQEAIDGHAMVGELSLDGQVRGVRGVLPMAIAARELGMRAILVPQENAGEAAVVDDIAVYPIRYLYEAVEFFLQKLQIDPIKIHAHELLKNTTENGEDFADVKGQEHAKRALEIAASGNHNILFKGPPGAGKTMLARRLPTILPDLSFDESLETTKIHSIAGVLPHNVALVTRRPFRAPHHTISDAGLIGGGSYPKPGEVSLATHGVLFLDELTEFKKRVLEMLRQPLEDRRVTISRAHMSLSFPADFLLVAAYNPCPCGYHGDPRNRCSCSLIQRERYMARLSGPLLDRMDIHLEIGGLSFHEMGSSGKGSSSCEMRERVNGARRIQKKRFAGLGNVRANADMTPKMMETFCRIDAKGQKFLEQGVDRLGLSARACHRILKLSRTIADLAGKEEVEASHVAEAIQLRRISSPAEQER